MAERQAQLLTCYRTPDTLWYLLPDDGYLYGHLAYHLAGTGQQEELEKVLLNFNWVQARLSGARCDASRSEAIYVYGLLADYDLAPQSPDASLVKRALQMSSHVIGKWPEQAGFQLYGRLATSDSPALRRLCSQAMGQTEGLAMVPLRPALGNPGSIVLTLVGHGGLILGATLLADSRRVLSWSLDSTLKLWDLERGELLHTLAGHEGEVYGAALLADGRRALSWSKDRTPRYWDLVNGKCLGIYVADASISTLSVGMQETRIFAGDTLGYIHCISLKPVNPA